MRTCTCKSEHLWEARDRQEKNKQDGKWSRKTERRYFHRVVSSCLCKDNRYKVSPHPYRERVEAHTLTKANAEFDQPSKKIKRCLLSELCTEWDDSSRPTCYRCSVTCSLQHREHVWECTGRDTVWQWLEQKFSSEIQCSRWHFLRTRIKLTTSGSGRQISWAAHWQEGWCTDHWKDWGSGEPNRKVKTGVGWAAMYQILTEEIQANKLGIIAPQGLYSLIDRQ